MKTQLILSLAVTASLTTLTGCLRQEFTAADSGRSVALPAGTAFTVRLQSNGSTGYQWQLNAIDQAVVANTGQIYIGPAVPIPGAGGFEEWDFVTQAAGTTTLQMSYRQPWDPDSPPAETFELTVTVPTGP
jgi:inhibitor of cysteine peptidase